MGDAVKLAVEAEKIFNNRNLLLMTFIDDNISLDRLKTIHNGVKNVMPLQPDFVPQTRYIIEVTDIFDVPSVMTALMEHNFEDRKVQVKLLEKYNDDHFGLDPCKLEVKNLPSSISNCDLKQLFPLSTDYLFVTPEASATSKTVVVNFANVQDAISCFKTVNLVKYNGNILSIKFFRKNVNMNASSTIEEIDRRPKKRLLAENDFWDYSTDDENHFANGRIKSERNEEVNTIQQRTDTLIVHNLPWTMEEKDILNLFPNLDRYKFLQKTASKSCIIRFKNTSEALAAYTNCDNIYKSRILQIEFYDKDFDQSDCPSSKTARFNRDRINQRSNRSNSAIPDNYFSIEKDIKKELEQHSENQDSLTLCVENLPINITKEDLRQLFPTHNTYQLHIDKIKDCAFAYICFLTTTAASNAYNSMQNKPFRGHVLSINFKSKQLKVNPFAAKISNSVDSKNAILNCNSQYDLCPPRSSTHVLRDLNGDLVDEDDVECKSEDNCPEEDDCEANSCIIDDYDSDGDFQTRSTDKRGLTDSILTIDED